MQTHQIVGEEVRAAIKRIGGVQPENLPIEEPIEKVKKRLAKGVRTENLPLRDREEE
jgi:DNA-damage-inducible protein D